MFFFFNYEGFRQTTQTSQNVVIPANNGFLNGVFRYVATRWRHAVGQRDAADRVADRREAARASICRSFRRRRTSITRDVGNSTTARLLNTAGYRFNQTDLNNREPVRVPCGLRAAPERHRFEGVYSYFKEIDDRTDLDLISPDRPLVYTNSDPKRYALAWRWVPTSNFQNELRGGANLAPVQFVTDWDYSAPASSTTRRWASSIPSPATVRRRSWWRRLPESGPLYRTRIS